MEDYHKGLVDDGDQRAKSYINKSKELIKFGFLNSRQLLTKRHREEGPSELIDKEMNPEMLNQYRKIKVNNLTID